MAGIHFLEIRQVHGTQGPKIAEMGSHMVVLTLGIV